jgi:erythromycin esterase
MRQEFRQNYRLFAVEEYVQLIEWMRDYNVNHPDREQLQFMGDDVYFPHVRIFEDIFGYARECDHPELVPQLKELYDGLIPTTDLGTWEREYDARPESERQQVQSQAEEALDLVERLRGCASDEAADWAEQQATVAAWVARTHATEDFATPRDQAMAENTVWWYQHNDGKILLSAHNAHVGYLGELPPHDFKRQGTWLREILGPGYVSIGLSFHHGSFTAIDADTAALEEFTVGAPPPENAERVLNEVRFPDYMLDMRTVDEPAREWLDEEHQVRYIVASYPFEPDNIDMSLGQTYSILIELRDVTASHPIPGVE